MDVALARLGSALAAAGLPALRPPTVDLTDELADLDELIAPLFRLPAEVRRFWEAVDLQSLPWVSPLPSTPDFAAQGWNDSVGIDMVPPALFPICYESHDWLYVELDDQEPRGGCFGCDVGDHVYELQFRSFADWVDLLAVAVETGAYEDRSNPNGSRLVLVDDPWWSQTALARLSAGSHDELYPAGLEINCYVQHWPERWLAPFDLVQADIHAVGASHVLADLASAPEQSFEARVEASWRWVRNTSPSGPAIVALTDDSGQVRVELAADVETFGQGVRGVREFDITVYPAEQRRSRESLIDGRRDGEPEIVGEITALRFVASSG